MADYNRTIRSYGFDDYFGVGDLIGMVRGGYQYDGITAEAAVSWMRNHAPRLAKEGKPWFLAVNLVNPHDAMFVNTDTNGSAVQDANHPMLGNAPPPNDALYRTSWHDVPLAASRRQPYDEPGRPPAHGMFNAAHANQSDAIRSPTNACASIRTTTSTAYAIATRMSCACCNRCSRSASTNARSS